MTKNHYFDTYQTIELTYKAGLKDIFKASEFEEKLFSVRFRLPNGYLKIKKKDLEGWRILE
jgi:hypothetical protein